VSYVVSFGKGVRETFGDSYDDFVDGLNALARNQEADVVRQVEERFHRAVVEAKSELKEEISQIRSELKEEISQVRSELKGEISQVRAELKGEISQVREEITRTRSELETRIATLHVSQLRWMFLFWIGQVGATLAIFSLLFLKQ
jgi:vacuolar-type H+-ATPase subunit I/STV1